MYEIGKIFQIVIIYLTLVSYWIRIHSINLNSESQLVNSFRVLHQRNHFVLTFNTINYRIRGNQRSSKYNKWWVSKLFDSSLLLRVLLLQFPLYPSFLIIIAPKILTHNLKCNLTNEILSYYNFNSLWSKKSNFCAIFIKFGIYTLRMY